MVVKVCIDVDDDGRQALLPDFLSGVYWWDACEFRQRYAVADSSQGLVALGWFFAHAARGIEIDPEAVLAVANGVFVQLLNDELNPFALPWLKQTGKKKRDAEALAAAELWARVKGGTKGLGLATRVNGSKGASGVGVQNPAAAEAAALVYPGDELSGAGVNAIIAKSAIADKHKRARALVKQDKKIGADWRLDGLKPAQPIAPSELLAEFVNNELLAVGSPLDWYLHHHRPERYAHRWKQFVPIKPTKITAFLVPYSGEVVAAPEWPRYPLSYGWWCGHCSPVLRARCQ